MLSLGVNLYECDVIALIRANVFRGVARLISQHNFDGLRAFHHMVIGQDVAARIDDKTGARAFHGNRVHEEIILGCFGEDVCHGRRSLPVDAHVDGFVLGQSRVAGGDGR